MLVPERSPHSMVAVRIGRSTRWIHPSELPEGRVALPELVIPVRPGHQPWPLYMAYVASVTSGEASLCDGFYPFRHLGNFRFELEYPSYGPVFERRPERPASHLYGGRLVHPDLEYRLMALEPVDLDLYEMMFAEVGLLVVGVPFREYRTFDGGPGGTR